MSNTFPLKTLADLKQGIQDGRIATKAPVAILAVLDLTANVLGQSRMQDPAVLASEAHLTAVLPRDPDPGLLTVFGDAAIYKRCRKGLFRQCQLAGLWDDPYPLLNEIAMAAGAPGINRTLIETHFPGRLPYDITRHEVLEVDRDLRGPARRQLRRVFRLLDQIRGNARIVAAGILRPDPIGPLPAYRDQDRPRIELPEDLAACLPMLGRANAIRARRAFELAVDVGILPENTPANQLEITRAGAKAYHAAVCDRVSRNSASLYLKTLIALIRAANPAVMPDRLAASAITSRPRKTAPPTPKKIEPPKPAVLPAALEAEIDAFAKLQRIGQTRITPLKRRLAKTMDDASLSGDWFPDNIVALHDAAHPDLPQEKRQSERDLIEALSRHMRGPCTWDLLLGRARDLALPGVDYRGLSLIKTIATAQDPALSPADITSDTAPALLHIARQRRYSTRGRLGIQSLDLLRDQMPDLLTGPAIGTLTDGRKHDNLDLPDKLEADLRAFGKTRGYAARSVKAQLVAVRKLYSCTADRAAFKAEPRDIPWAELLKAALESHPQQMKRYRPQIQRLAECLARNLSPGWHRLNTLLCALSVSREENPIERLSQVARLTDFEPWQLDREWAWGHERGLRPDLRHTWSRAIDLFDALRDMPEVAGSNLMPTERLGPMPVTGARCKHAEFPLPHGIEAALVGEDRQVLEAAHFVWRVLRHLRVYDRGDTPSRGELFADAHLDRVRQSQSLISVQAAKLHLARIRDWRSGQELTGGWGLGLEKPACHLDRSGLPRQGLHRSK